MKYSFGFKWEPRDLWVGAYVGDDTLFVQDKLVQIGADNIVEPVEE